MSTIRLVRLLAFPRSIPYATPFDTVARLRIVRRKDVGRDQSNLVRPVPRGHEDKMLGDSNFWSSSSLSSNVLEVLVFVHTESSASEVSVRPLTRELPQ